MLDANVRNGYLDHVEPLGDAGNPLVAPNRSETLGHGLISYNVAAVTSTLWETPSMS